MYVCMYVCMYSPKRDVKLCCVTCHRFNFLARKSRNVDHTIEIDNHSSQFFVTSSRVGLWAHRAKAKS